MTGKVLLVTGGGRGIGAAICRLAAKNGYAVAVNYRGNAAAAAETVGAIERAGGRAAAIAADVSKESEVERLFAETERRLGPLTHLVNNAGMTGRAGRLDAVPISTLEAVFDLNILGAFLCARGDAAALDAAWRHGRRDRQHLLGRRHSGLGRRVGLVRRLESGGRYAHHRPRPRACRRRRAGERGGARPH
jgi:NAD(P)-dependent dehydrogenase (short-subunit alcohol dehydrogenase family)